MSRWRTCCVANIQRRTRFKENKYVSNEVVHSADMRHCLCIQLFLPSRWFFFHSGNPFDKACCILIDGQGTGPLSDSKPDFSTRRGQCFAQHCPWLRCMLRTLGEETLTWTMMGASEVLRSCVGWLMVSASSTTSCRDRASSNIRSISLCTSAAKEQYCSVFEIVCIFVQYLK